MAGKRFVGWMCFLIPFLAAGCGYQPDPSLELDDGHYELLPGTWGQSSGRNLDLKADSTFRECRTTGYDTVANRSISSCVHGRWSIPHGKRPFRIDSCGFETGGSLDCEALRQTDSRPHDSVRYTGGLVSLFLEKDSTSHADVIVERHCAEEKQGLFLSDCVKLGGPTGELLLLLSYRGRKTGDGALIHLTRWVEKPIP